MSERKLLRMRWALVLDDVGLQAQLGCEFKTLIHRKFELQPRCCRRTKNPILQEQDATQAHDVCGAELVQRRCRRDVSLVIESKRHFGSPHAASGIVVVCPLVHVSLTGRSLWLPCSWVYDTTPTCNKIVAIVQITHYHLAHRVALGERSASEAEVVRVRATK